MRACPELIAEPIADKYAPDRGAIWKFLANEDLVAAWFYLEDTCLFAFN